MAFICHSRLRQNIPVSLFFISLLAIGLLAYDDYGVAWDEAPQRRIGEVNYNYVAGKIGKLFTGEKASAQQMELLDFYDKEYGPIFEILLYSVEKLFFFNDDRNVFLARHLLIFFFFWLSLIFFYKLILIRYQDWKIGLIGVVFLILSPRIFAHSFYNSKDIICMSMCIISTYSLMLLLMRRTLLLAFIHALSTAALINIRMIGLIMPVASVVFIFFELRSRDALSLSARLTTIYLLTLVCFSIFFWPYLWNDPLQNFVEIFSEVKTHETDGILLYWGSFIKVTELPWHYVPSWIGISTPFIILVLFSAGLVSLVASLLTRPFSFLSEEKKKLDLLFLFLFAAPLLAIMFFKTMLYDDWRHLYFVYPFLLMIALSGLITLIRGKRRTRSYRVLYSIVVVFGVLNFFFISIFMIKHHPYQNVYFNLLAGRDASKKFEMDYWGLSYRQALQYVLEHDSSSSINIKVWDMPGERNLVMLNERDRERLNYTDWDNATYFITNFRFNHPLHLPWYDKFQAKEFPFVNEEFNIEVGNCKIMAVYRLK